MGIKNIMRQKKNLPKCHLAHFVLGIYSWAWVLALSVVCTLSGTALEETNVFIYKQLSIGNSFWENSRETRPSKQLKHMGNSQGLWQHVQGQSRSGPVGGLAL